MSNTDTGAVRVPLDQLAQLHLIHLVSGLDEEGEPDCGEGALATCITGYTEWIGRDRITIGWDWEMLAADAIVTLRRVGGPASNLALCGADGGALGPAGTALALAAYLDRFQWQLITLRHIQGRYMN
ncbi:DUF4902 domain-containing protein [Oxalobacteraceae bacterium A2-2]